MVKNFVLILVTKHEKKLTMSFCQPFVNLYFCIKFNKISGKQSNRRRQTGGSDHSG